MRRTCGLILVALVAACDAQPPAPSPPAALPAPNPPHRREAPPPPPLDALPPDQAALLADWYQRLGPRKERESFGELVVRAGLLQLGKPYALTPDDRTDEPLRIDLTSFECQNFVEGALAVARCLWLDRADAACFAQEVTGFRYRGGVRTDFTSRLHYFSDWISDNVDRGRLRLLTTELGGVPRRRDFFHFTKHAEKYPSLASPEAQATMKAVESRLSSTDHPVLDRVAAEKAKGRLESGDLVAIVTSKPGVLISHTGLILRGHDGVPRLLHASSHHKRVMVTSDDVASYIRRWPDRQGLMVTRPTPPPTGLAAR